MGGALWAPESAAGSTFVRPRIAGSPAQGGVPVELLGRAAPRIRGHQAEALLTSTLLLRLLGIEHVGVSIDEQALHRALRATVSSERVACSVPNCLSYVLRLAACLTTPSWLPVIWSRRPAWRSGRCEQRVTYVLPERLPAHHHTSSLSLTHTRTRPSIRRMRA